MIPQTLPQTQDDTLLRRALYGNVIFTTASALACLLDAGPLADLLRLPSPFILMGLGIGLLGYAALVYRIAARQPIRRADALIPIVADGLWVIGSWMLLVINRVPFSQAGWWIVAVVADVVAVFAVVQYLGLRRMNRGV